MTAHYEHLSDQVAVYVADALLPVSTRSLIRVPRSTQYKGSATVCP